MMPTLNFAPWRTLARLLTLPSKYSAIEEAMLLRERAEGLRRREQVWEGVKKAGAVWIIWCGFCNIRVNSVTPLTDCGENNALSGGAGGRNQGVKALLKVGRGWTHGEEGGWGNINKLADKIEIGNSNKHLN